MDGKYLLLATIVFIAGLDGIKGHRPPCGSHEYRCYGDHKCIPRRFHCDGKYDCPDESDESYCYYQREHYNCPSEFSYCGNGVRCIPSVWKCDGVTDCPDGSDELGCLQTTTPPTITGKNPCTPNPCQNKGKCQISNGKATCLCEEPFTGRNCTIDRCDPNPCQNEGKCQVSNEKVTCVCQDPFTGAYCTIHRCDPNPCQYKGECKVTEGELTCLCKDPYTGPNCTVVSIPEKNISSITGVDTTTDNMIRSLKAKKDNSRSIAKWGPELPRIAATLFLSDPQIFAPGNATGAELACELSLQMMAKLALKKKITTQKLALFMNALAVSCIDLKDFFGVNLVAELRKRVNNGDYTNPFTYLTLCGVGDTMTPTDVTNIASTFEARRRPLWTDVQALATMAMTCMNSRDDSLVNDETLASMVKELKKRQHANGTVVSLRTTALVMQALIATNSYRVDFDFAGAVKYLVREAANRSLSVQEMYYILPVLKSVSFVNVSSNHCSAPIKTELQILQTLRESVEERIPVRVSMFIGNDVDFSRNWQLKVPATYNFYQVLENIGTLEPTYKVRYSIGQDKKPYIVGIHKYFDNADDQMFWFIFSQKLRNATRRTLVDKSPVDIQLKEDEELIVWYRSGVWVDSP